MTFDGIVISSEETLDTTALPAGARPDALWPFVTDPAALLVAITEWLLGYKTQRTQHTYAEHLGLPVSGNDFAAWAFPEQEPDGWAAARASYKRALKIPAPQPSTSHWSRARGPFRSLHWFRWLVAHELDPLHVKSVHVKEWLSDLADAGAAPSTRDAFRTAAKALYEYLAEVELVDANPVAINRRRLGLDVTQNTSPTIVLTPAQVRALLRSAGTRSPRQTALSVARELAMVALFTLGLRVSEVCYLNRADLHVTRGRRALRVHGKGGKERVVYLSTLADDGLAAYLTMLDSAAGSVVTQLRANEPHAMTPLIVTRRGNRYTRQELWRVLRRIAASGGDELADIAEAIHPHALRHFYATAGVDSGAPESDVSLDLGHSSTEVTRRVYVHAARSPERSAVDIVAHAIQHG
jgi:site-specific recombinase XerD